MLYIKTEVTTEMLYNLLKDKGYSYEGCDAIRKHFEFDEDCELNIQNITRYITEVRIHSQATLDLFCDAFCDDFYSTIKEAAKNCQCNYSCIAIPLSTSILIIQ